MRLYLSRMHHPVTTLGPGRRLGIWFQGCSLHCPGCISADTWERGRGQTTIAAVMETITPWLEDADGVTISGGEPFEQIEALEHLLSEIRTVIGGERDVLIYSGLPWEKIAPHADLWDGLADALICDPFIRSAGQTLVWRGSDNQRLVFLTELGHRRYQPWVRALRVDSPKAFDVFFDSDSLWMAGIPEGGSLDGIQQALARAGFSSNTTEKEGGTARSLPFFA